MTDTYSSFSDICTKFYDLVIDSKEVARFVYEKIQNSKPKTCLFVGGFFLVAKELQNLGLELTVVDYTDEMVKEAHKRLPETKILKADLRKLPFNNQFDAVVVVGRVFTHMLTNEDSSNALQSIYNSLKPDGIVFLDNYEDSKIQVTDYFNGEVIVSNEDVEIIRNSSTELLSQAPMIVNWSAEYHAKIKGQSTTYKDQMPHRAFSRKEIQSLLEEHNFSVISQGDNFDETSFYTVAYRKD